MTSAFTIECRVHFTNRGRGSRKRPPSDRGSEAGRVPRVSRLMALAMRLDELIRSGEVTGYAELARLGHVTPARLSQIVSLLIRCRSPQSTTFSSIGMSRRRNRH